MPTLAQEGHAAVLARMAAGVRRLAARAPAGEVASVGVGVPGLVEAETGVVRDLFKLPGGWPGVPVAAELAAATGLAVAVLNDARAFVAAEHALGAAAGAEIALCVTVGTGVGGGIVAHGRPLFGRASAAGEIGHLIVDADGPRCTCGNRGCFEPLASGPAIAAEAARLVSQGFTTALTALAAGDPGAITPEVVVLDGGVAQPGGRYWRAAETSARADARVTPVARIPFRPTPAHPPSA